MKKMKELQWPSMLFLEDIKWSLIMFLTIAIGVFWAREADHIAVMTGCFMLVMVAIDGLSIKTFIRIEVAGTALFLLFFLIVKVWALTFICPAPSRVLCIGLARGITFTSVVIVIVYLFALLLIKTRENWST